MSPNGETILVEPDANAAMRAAESRCLEVLRGRPGETRSVALAGGSTPKGLYAALTTSLKRDPDIALEGIAWFFGDERCVPPDDDDSNYRMARETLLEPLGVSKERVFRMPSDAPDLDAAAAAYERDLREHIPLQDEGVPVLDLVLLGVGGDGHTASLFPGSAGLEERERLVVAHHVPRLDAMRMTLTYPVLRSARRIIFLATGEKKADALGRILRPANDSGLPAAALRPGGEHAARGEVFWILDADAARLVKTDGVS